MNVNYQKAHLKDETVSEADETGMNEDTPARETLAEIFERRSLYDELIDLCLNGENFIGVEIAP